jgi:hypothetical protein
VSAEHITAAAIQELSCRAVMLQANENLYSLRFCKLNWRHIFAITRNFNSWLDSLLVPPEQLLHSNIPSWLRGIFERAVCSSGYLADDSGDVEEEQSPSALLLALDSLQPPLLTLSKQCGEPSGLSVLQRLQQQEEDQGSDSTEKESTDKESTDMSDDAADLVFLASARPASASRPASPSLAVQMPLLV